MSHFTTTQLASHNLGIPVDILDMEADQLDDYLALAGSDGCIYIQKLDPKQDSNNIQPVATIKFHIGAVICVHWLPMQHGRVLISGGEDGRLIIVKEQNNTFQKVTDHNIDAPISDIAIYDDNIVVCSLDGNINLFTITPQLQLSHSNQPVLKQTIPVSCSLIKQQKTSKLVVGNFQGEVYFYQNYDEATKQIIDQTAQVVKSVAFGTDIITDFITLAVGYCDKLKLFRFKDDKFTLISEHTIENISRVKFGITGRVVGVVKDDGSVQLFDVLDEKK